VIFRFGDCEIDSARCELRRAGAPVRIEPKVLDLLVHLVSERARLVSKQELLDAVWPKVHVTESTRTRAVSLARSAVGDSAQAHAVIETVCGRGYRWKAPVKAVKGSEGIDPAPPPLVVLPFTDLSPDEGRRHLSEAFAWELTYGLLRCRDLFVISRVSAALYPDRPVPLETLADQLGARYAVTGSVRAVDERIVVHAQLVELSSGVGLWAERLDIHLGDVLDAPFRLAEQLAGALGAWIGDAERAGPCNRPTREPDGCESFVGRGTADQRAIVLP